MKYGDKLKNGAVVLKFYTSQFTTIVLAHWPERNSATGHDEYVTWRIDSEGNTFLGHYYDKGSKAEAGFYERITSYEVPNSR